MNPLTGKSRAWRNHGIARWLAALRAKYAGAEPPPTEGISGWTLAGVIALLLLTPAAALRSKHLCNLYDADSLLPALISLQKLTLFYWGQNRFGNLLPFLTTWIHDINLNFQVQTYLRALGTASMPLFVFCFIGLRRYFLATYAIALALAFLPFRDIGNYAIWVEAEPYGHSLLLLLCTLLIHRHNRWQPNRRDLPRSMGALLLVCLALYVNGALILFAFPLWLGYAILFPRARNWWFVAFLLAGYLCSSLLSTFYGQEYNGAFNYTRIAFSFSNLAHFGGRFASVASAPLFAVYFAVMAGGLAAVQCAFLRRRVPGSPLLEPLALKSLLIFAAAVLYILVVANMEWTSLNDFAFRYFWFALALVPPLCAVGLTQGISASAILLRGTRKSAEDGSRHITAPDAATASIAIALLAAAVFHNLAPFEIPPSFVEQPRRDDALALAALARQYGASFVAGNYYLVWPAVFETIRKGQAVNDPYALNIRGLAPKSEHQRDEIADDLRSSQRVVVLDADATPAGCYHQALVNDAVDWPPYASILAHGTLPSGKLYSVMAFERASSAGNVSYLPDRPAVLFHMLKPLPQVAKWENEKIVVPAGGQPRRAFNGPFVNVAPGNYRVAFQIEALAAPAAILFRFQIMDGFGKRILLWKDVRFGDLEPRNGGLWVSADFTVTESNPTQNLEFGIWTFGNAPFTVSAMELQREP